MVLPFILIALSCGGACNSSVAVAPRFETMEECQTAKQAILDAYPENFLGYSKFQEQDMQCIDLRGKDHTND